jgi:hypothetical protein
MDQERKKRLLRNGREECQFFEPDEQMFQRFTDLVSVGDKHLYPNSIRFPVFSVNRERFSEPTDVLYYDYPNCLNQGVSAFNAKDIPVQFPVYDNHSKTKNIYDFCIWHDPKKDNYSHSEVRGYKNNHEARRIAKTVKKWFKIKLSERISIIKDPEI